MKITSRGRAYESFKQFKLPVSKGDISVLNVLWVNHLLWKSLELLPIEEER